MDRGVVIIALGHQVYGDMAANLAMSIKYSSNEFVHLIYDDNVKFPDKYGKFLDGWTKFPYELNGHYQASKFKLCELTPFDRTLFLDADTIINENVDVGKYFDLRTSFRIGCLGYYEFGADIDHSEGYTYWAHPIHIQDTFNLSNPLPKTYSGIILFDKNEDTDLLFKTANEVYWDEQSYVMIPEWAGGLPDEFCFNVALSLMEMHDTNYWMPIYFGGIGKRTHHQFKTDFDGITIAGNNPTGYIYNYYQEVIRKMAHAFGVNVHEPDLKKNVIKERAEW